jgi:hypothetical protein
MTATATAAAMTIDVFGTEDDIASLVLPSVLLAELAIGGNTEEERVTVVRTDPSTYNLKFYY